MDLIDLIDGFGPGLPKATLAEFAPEWTLRLAKKGDVLARQGEHVTREVMVLDGKIVSHITDGDGRGVCVGLYSGPGFVTPHIARTHESVSLVSLDVVEDATIAEMRADVLLVKMLRSPEIRDWANGILRDELSRKTDREWCLAALGGGDRLTWFRDRYPDHEALFAHSQIASFIGMTPVTLSRLRQSS